MLSAFMRLLDRLDRVLLVSEKVLICLTLSLMLGISALQVVLRNLFNTGISWGDVFVRHMVLLLLFFGASLSTRNQRHIQMDVSSHLIPARLKPYLGLCLNAFCIFMNGVLFQASLKFMLDERQAATLLFGQVPVWWFLLSMPVGFGMITLRFTMNWIDNILVLTGAKKAKPRER
ncbi:MAG: TRAP transporter small permease [bacterium]|nr:TRAP transporter small permease [bacterium]